MVAHSRGVTAKKIAGECRRFEQSAGDQTLFEHPVDHGRSFFAFSRELTVGTVDFEVRNGLDLVLLRHGGLPVDAFGVGAIDIHFDHGDVVPLFVQLIEFRRDGLTRGAIFAGEIKDRGFPGHQVVSQIYFGAVGDPQRFRAFLVVAGRGGGDTGEKRAEKQRKEVWFHGEEGSRE